MRRLILFLTTCAILQCVTYASAANVEIQIGKTRDELAKYYAPIVGAQKGDRLIFNVDIGGVPCELAYRFIGDVAQGVHCTVNSAGLTNQKDALAKWSKLIKTALGTRHPTDIKLKLDGMPVVGDLDTQAPTAVWMTGSWDDKYDFLAVFSGPSPKVPQRTEIFDMILNITPKVPNPI